MADKETGNQSGHSWSAISESWGQDQSSYRSDYYLGVGDGYHIHDWYEVGANGIDAGAVLTNEQTGEHSAIESVR